MSNNKKNKTSLASRIKERAQNPDYQPHNFVEDSTRLADETIPRSHVSALASPTPTAHSAPKAPVTVPSQNLAPQEPNTELARQRANARPVTRSRTTETVSTYRQKMNHAGTYLDDQPKEQLRTLCFTERTSEEDLVREAINFLFADRGLPQNAFLGAPSRNKQ